MVSDNATPQVNIRVTNRYILTGFAETDFSALHEMATFKGFVYSVMNGRPDEHGQRIPMDISVRNYLDKILHLNNSGADATYFFAIRDTKRSNKLIGSCNIRQTENAGEAVFGIFIHPEYQDKKIARRACFVMIKHAIENLGLTSLYATIDPENFRSQKLCSALGLKITDEHIHENDSAYLDEHGKKRPRLIFKASMDDMQTALEQLRIAFEQDPDHAHSFLENLYNGDQTKNLSRG